MSKNKTDIITKNMSRHNNSKGFTLIEVALAVLIIGLIMTPLLALYNAQYKQRMINESQGRLDDIGRILDNYVQNNDRYPIPASFLTSEADTDHGAEGVTPDTCPDVTTNGFCLFDNGTAADPSDDIYIGAVPFAELRMEADLALDTWGNKIIYAVARVQTDTATFNILGSDVISALALDATTNLPEPEYPNELDVFLFSAGQMGKGAYSAEGILVADCIDLGQPEYEDENCDFDDSIFMADENRNELVTPFGTEDHGTRAFVEGVQEYYDDVTLAIDSPEVNQWNENIIDSDYVTTIKNRIGIGENAINPQHSLDVDGDILIENDLVTGKICTGTGECFRPVEIYGAEDDMNCDENNISGLEPVIAVGATSGTTQVFCGSTTLNGSGGDPIIEDQEDQNGDKWGTFRLNGIPFENSAGAGDPTNCADSSQNLTSITGTGTGSITCVTPI